MFAEESAAEPAQAVVAAGSAEDASAEEEPEVSEPEAASDDLPQADYVSEADYPVKDEFPAEPEEPAAVMQEATADPLPEAVPAPQGQGDPAEISPDPEDSAAPEQEEPQKENPYPAQVFHGETSDLIVEAAVSEGVFPAGSTMEIRRVTRETAMAAGEETLWDNYEIVDAVAADITFYDPMHTELQPGDGQTVHVTLTSKRPVAGTFHYAASEQDDRILNWASPNQASFDAKHFTVYGIIGGNYSSDEVDDIKHYVRDQFTYYNGDPSSDKSTWLPVTSEDAPLVYRYGDTITTPESPTGDSKYSFIGWYIEEIGGVKAEGSAAKEVFSRMKVEDFVPFDPKSMTAQEIKEAEEAGTLPADPIEIKVYASYVITYCVTLYTEASEDAKVYTTCHTVKEETVAGYVVSYSAETNGGTLTWAVTNTLPTPAPKPTPTPTPTPEPSEESSPSSGRNPSPSPSVKPTSTPAANTPKTGDESHTAIWLILALAAAAGLAVLTLSGKRKRNP